MKLLRLWRASPVALVASLLLGNACADPQAPVLFSTDHYQSPVRGDPGELLLIPGSGFSTRDKVAYTLLAEAAQYPLPPRDLPVLPTEQFGIAPIVKDTFTPHGITVELPKEMKKGAAYALWVRAANGSWSNAAKINDPRPLWISPAFAYAKSSIPGLPRYLKVVGRNLQPVTDSTTQVRLVGPQTFTLDAIDDLDPSTAIEHYAAHVVLPLHLPPGTYAVSVRRDRGSWTPLKGSELTVFDDPVPVAQFPVSKPTHGCAPNDHRDDTPCILAAIATANSSGGGTVLFESGTWLLNNSEAAGVTHGDGIVVPPGVNLQGIDARSTTLVRGREWGSGEVSGKVETLITLQGRNVVQGITFSDERTHQPHDPRTRVIGLGKRFDRRSVGDPPRVDDVIITSNVFDRPFTAIGDGGLPIRRLIVTHNVFGAYYRGLAPAGRSNNLRDRFQIEDSIISHNTFHPGSYLDVVTAQGTIASEFGASLRVDFSDNVADGSSAAYLGSTHDAKGWRAAFFWHLNGSHEQLLVSKNVATCTGDKAGDGEAFAFDDNHNSYAFSRAAKIIRATADTITVAGELVSVQEGVEIDPSTHYVGSWISIAEGQGLGQTRRITSYVAHKHDSTVTFTLAPRWDVVPNAGRVTVGRIYWQVQTVDNVVDHRRPLCAKSNRTRPKGGVITYWARTSDSAIEGNRQFDTDGILLPLSYRVLEPTCRDCTATVATQKTFVEVRSNLVDGEYDWNSDCSWSGIQLSLASSRLGSSPPPTLGYGIVIGRNHLIRADGQRGGAISSALSWHAGPPPHEWPLLDMPLIYGNTIEELEGARPWTTCMRSRNHALVHRVAINVDHAMSWRATLLSNTCKKVSSALNDKGTLTASMCRSPAVDSCECFDAQARD